MKLKNIFGIFITIIMITMNFNIIFAEDENESYSDTGISEEARNILQDDKVASEQALNVNANKDNNYFRCSDDYDVSSELINNLKKLDEDLNNNVSLSNSRESINNVNSNGVPYCPSTGNIKVLTVMVDFSDEKFGSGFTEDYLSKLMFGDEDKNSQSYPNESLSAWYKRSSYGKLNFSGNVESISLDNTKAYYTLSDKNPDGDNLMHEEIWKKISNLNVNWDDYDSNDDGYIDAVCLVISGNAGEWASQWWSKCLWGSYGLDTLDGRHKIAHYAYCMESHMNGSNGYTSADTAIHEFGHILGLPDLYNQKQDLAGDMGIHTSDMMNNNYGDFNGFCKMLLGWIENDNIKTINNINDINTIELFPYEDTGDTAILYTDNNNRSLFSEYFIIQYFVPGKSNDSGIYERYKKKSLRIYHVNAELTESGYFKYRNTYSNYNKLIQYVDRDTIQMHTTVQDSFSNGTTILSNILNISDASGCEYKEGDEFTPYTSPSTAAYNSDGLSASRGRYTGLYVNNIKISDDKAFFNVFYEKEKQDLKIEFEFNDKESSKNFSGKNMFQINSNRDIWLVSDLNKKVYLRKKGENKSISYASISMEHGCFGGKFLHQGHGAMAVKLETTPEVENNTEYEIVFPAGLFVTSYGVFSEEIALGVKTPNIIWSEKKVSKNLDLNKFDALANNEFFLINDEHNIETIAQMADRSVCLCTFNSYTGNLMSTIPLTIDGKELIKEACRREDDWAVTSWGIKGFGKCDNSLYWIAFSNDASNTIDSLYFFSEDGKILKSFDDMNIEFSNSSYHYLSEPIRYLGYNKIQLGNSIFDAETYTLMTLSLWKDKWSTDKNYLSNVFAADKDTLLTCEYRYGNGQEYMTYIRDSEGNIIRQLELDSFTDILYLIPKNNSYTMLCTKQQGNKGTYAIELNKNFQIMRSVKLYDKIINPSLNCYPTLKDGFILDYDIYDKNYNYVETIDSPELVGTARMKTIISENKSYLVVHDIVNMKKQDNTGGEIRFECQISNPIDFQPNDSYVTDTIKLSDDIAFGLGYTVLYDPDTEPSQYADNITPISDEIYKVEKYADSYYLVVSNKDETASLYYKLKDKSTAEQEKPLYGDIDNDSFLTFNDAAILLKKVLDNTTVMPIEESFSECMKYADVDNNGVLTATDAAIIIQKVLKDDFVMPVEK